MKESGVNDVRFWPETPHSLLKADIGTTDMGNVIGLKKEERIAPMSD